MKTKFISIAATLLLAASFNTAFADNWIGNSAVNVNGTWYYCGSNLDWCSGPFQSTGESDINLGEITTLMIGGQSQVNDNVTGPSWNAESTVSMFYIIDGNELNPLPCIPLNIFVWGGKYNGTDYGVNMVFQSGGKNFAGTSIDISGLDPNNTHTIEIFFHATYSSGYDMWDNWGYQNNYKARFKIKEPKAISSSENFANVTNDDVLLNGLTLYKTGNWNTLCLPFDLTRGKVEMSDLKNAEIREFTGSSFDGGTLTLTFSQALNVASENDVLIHAGTPYIVRWTSGSTVENPIFTNVTIDPNVQAGSVSGPATFKGTFNPIKYTEENTSILYLGAGNNLYYPSPTNGSSVTIGAFRAYFELNGITAGEPLPGQQGIKSFVLNFGDDNEETSIKQINNTESATNTYFTLDGRRLNEKPATAGLYIINGKKVVIK